MHLNKKDLANLIKEETEKVLSERCWDGYKRNPKIPKGDRGSCIDKTNEVEEAKVKKPCKKAKGKRYVKRVNGRCRSFGQAGKAKDGGDRIRPGTKKGDAYCARSVKIKKCKNPPCANALSRKKWKCRGSKSMKEQTETNS